MIVKATPNGWEVIYHRAHALLAAQLAGQWRRKNAPERLCETLAAISHDDDLEKEWEERWCKELGIKKEKVDAAYAFMQWCDHLSLILCQEELPADERFLEISKGPEGQRYDIMQRSDNLVVVKPWPFQDDKFTVNVEACDIFQVKFESSTELAQALQEAPIKVLKWTFVKS